EDSTNENHLCVHHRRIVPLDNGQFLLGNGEKNFFIDSKKLLVKPLNLSQNLIIENGKFWKNDVALICTKTDQNIYFINTKKGNILKTIFTGIYSRKILVVGEYFVFWNGSECQLWSYTKMELEIEKI